MTEKKRILFIGEASFLNTGFSNIYRSLIPRLLATGKYEIAEHGSYAKGDHPDIDSVIAGRWKFYPGLPSTPEEQQQFQKFVQCPRPRAKGQNTAQFGEWNFNDVVADFQPDIVLGIRDFWMDEFVEHSPFRAWFKHIWMPTVDSPQQDEVWINGYENCNLVLSYSDFGINTLKSQSPRIKLYPEPMRPGVDMNIFKPMDKAEIREKYNINKNLPIIGLVQRNQSRKMILDVLDAFALMKNRNPDPEVQKAVLVLHTSWPDNMHSFDYPRHIKRLQSDSWMQHHRPGIMNDVMQTLVCNSCGETSLVHAVHLHGKPIQQVKTPKGDVRAIILPCSYCGEQAATCPTTGNGVSREQLAEIYNLFDVFVQCSIAEGCGMPVQEAKACGVPTIVTDHSAIAEKGRFPSDYSHIKELGIKEKDYTVNLGGVTHKVAGYRHEPETGCLRAVPDISDLADRMAELVKDSSLRNKLSQDAIKCASENYNWDEVAKKWEFVLDRVKPLDRSQTWDSPIEPYIEIEPKPIPEGLDDEAFVAWLYSDVLRYPKIDGEGAKMWIMQLKQGATREQLLQKFVEIGRGQSDASKVRDMIRSKKTPRTNKKRIEIV